jgi:hypothetical protein
MRQGELVELDRLPRARRIRVPSRVAIYEYPSQGLPTHVVRVIDPRLIPITFAYDSDPDGRKDLVDLWRKSGRSCSGVWDPHPLG